MVKRKLGMKILSGKLINSIVYIYRCSEIVFKWLHPYCYIIYLYVLMVCTLGMKILLGKLINS